MWSFQITYMTPIRRARAALLPNPSVARSRLRKCVAYRRSRPFSALSRQSNARPSLCSEVPDAVHERAIPEDPEPGYRFTRYSARITVPRLGVGLQVLCGTYCG